MRAFRVFVAAAFLSGCASTEARITAALGTVQGQLFCAVQTSGGGAVVAGLVDALAAATLGPAAPIAVIATGAAKAFVDAMCRQAGGVPVPPPATAAPVPMIAVIVPSNQKV